MTMATPLSAVSTTLDVSCLSSVSALHCIGLRLLWLLHRLCCCLSRKLSSDLIQQQHQQGQQTQQ